MNCKRIIVYICLGLCIYLYSKPTYSQQPAFPGAVGYGRMATDWRGGRIVYVNNLNDNGPGSLRDCAEDKSGPRVCVFSISGTIEVDSPIAVAPGTYIAGQTSPGDGVQLKLGKSNRTPLVIKNADGVLVRFLKLRPGSTSSLSANIDGVTIEDSQRTYLDHLSVQFATDENVNVHVALRPTRDITIANSIIAYGLDHANHPKGRHSKGALICSSEHAATECGRVSLIGNLIAHNRDRNPDLKGTDVGPIEVVNNVIYNPKSQFGEFYNLLGNTYISYVGNIAMAGPSTRRHPRPAAVQAFRFDENFGLFIWVDDNINGVRPDCGPLVKINVVDPRAETFLVDEPIPVTVSNPHPASATMELVLDEAGARTPKTWTLDSLDSQIIETVRTCSGHVVDRVDQTPGWPDLPVISLQIDGDGDGMPDNWEGVMGLDPVSPDDAWLDADGDGWSNIENYLNALVSHRDKNQSHKR